MDRSAETAMLQRLREKLPALTALLNRISREGVYDDLVYRFYHYSFKVYRVQDLTQEVVTALQCLAPEQPLNGWFLEIVKQGAGHTFDLSHNEDWLLRARPMLEAFFHAKFMLEMAVKHGERLREATVPPDYLDSGWAALLCLYGIR